VERTEEFWSIFERAQQTAGPMLIELVTDPEYLTPETTVSARVYG